ncbi:gamma-glutamylcyclotransferase family protein [Rothia nasimurium]|uniref:gamma-glutamylcyclotransferase family protein n=1 Tax=Rothia nasimurium TaxID=85336 RepID=UPI002DD65AE1|nr:gamma-glutamylcyclotransferase family protein [Rothia nasimurium]
MTRHLPVFVYGTLRPGGSNEHVFGSAARTHVPATLAGFEMVSNSSYPYILSAQAGADGAPPLITGTLVFIAASDWSTTVNCLDELEGTDPRRPISDANLYNRVQKTVTAADGSEHTAWVYIPPRIAQAGLRQRYRLVESGDWFKQ